MISTYIHQLKILFNRLLILYLVYLICRLFFYFSNISFFQTVSAFELVLDLVDGLRFDSFTIVVANCLFIVLSLLPFNFFWNTAYQKLLFCIYVLSNSVFIAVNCIDVGYFPFIRKRSSADLLKQIGGQSDLRKLIPQFLQDFWWIIITYILILVLMVYLYKRIQPILSRKHDFKGFRQKLMVFFLFLLSTSLAVLGARGGFQRVPISIVDAIDMTSSKEVAIILNSPFTIIKSLEKKTLEEYTFYQPRELKAIYDPIHHYKDSVFKKQNVVVIILESFAKEYTKLGRRSYTPFLDSLMGQSLICSNAFSNGTKSIEGIPAILSSLPSLSENPFINSVYSLNDQTSLATLLGKEGYETAFFHGGINGTMNFDSWSKLAGYKSYKGKDEYNNNEDFDGFWGIWDEPFLQYSVREMSRFKQPFHTAVFTLSSHHPYQVPKKYTGKFPKGDLANSETIGYADYALSKFFEAAKKTNWYAHTLFVVTADHGSLSKAPFWRDVVGNLCLPVLFFKGDNSLKGIHAQVFSQIDILPSALQLIGYNKPFFSFGESYASKTTGSDYFYANATHYLFGDSLLYCFNFPKLSVVYNYRSDSTLSTLVTNKYPLLDSLQTIHYKAFMQTYNHTLIHNKGRVK